MEAECVILIPVLAEGQPVRQPGPDGRSYPVLRETEDSPLVGKVKETLAQTFCSQALRLNRRARAMVLWDLPESTPHAVVERKRLSQPAYLLLSQDEGGYARRGFWLEESGRGADGPARRFIPGDFVDLVVGETAVARGFLEEVFPHELGHVTMSQVLGKLPPGQARNMHMSMAVTDYPTAFVEGWAEHFQTMAVDATINPYLRGLARPDGADLMASWHSRVDGWLRTAGVRRNLLAHRKTLPAEAMRGADPYDIYLDYETSASFAVDELKGGQEMLACEGFIATLFYRLATSERLGRTYREPSFYARFRLPDESREGISPEATFGPIENAYLKLIAAMRELGRTPLSPERPYALQLVAAYARLFPDEAEAVYGEFVQATWGATVSQALAAQLEETAKIARRGAYAQFRDCLPKDLAAMRDLVADLVAGRVSLDAGLGPELWLLNSGFLIASPVFFPERRVPLAINLNAASEAHLMTIPGIDFSLAGGIVAARRRAGFFTDLAEIGRVPGVSPALVDALGKMQADMAQAGLFERE